MPRMSTQFGTERNMWVFRTLDWTANIECVLCVNGSMYFCCYDTSLCELCTGCLPSEKQFLVTVKLSTTILITNPVTNVCSVLMMTLCKNYFDKRLCPQTTSTSAIASTKLTATKEKDNLLRCRTIPCWLFAPPIILWIIFTYGTVTKRTEKDNNTE